MGHTLSAVSAVWCHRTVTSNHTRDTQLQLVRDRELQLQLGHAARDRGPASSCPGPAPCHALVTTADSGHTLELPTKLRDIITISEKIFTSPC